MTFALCESVEIKIREKKCWQQDAGLRLSSEASLLETGASGRVGGREGDRRGIN